MLPHFCIASISPCGRIKNALKSQVSYWESYNPCAYTCTHQLNNFILYLVESKGELKGFKEGESSWKGPDNPQRIIRWGFALKKGRKEYIIPRTDHSMLCLPEHSWPYNISCTLTMRWREKGNSNVNFNKINLACWFHCNVILAQCPEGEPESCVIKGFAVSDWLRRSAWLLGSVAPRCLALEKPHPINWNCRKPPYRHVYTIKLFSFFCNILCKLFFLRKKNPATRHSVWYVYYPFTFENVVKCLEK